MGSILENTQMRQVCLQYSHTVGSPVSPTSTKDEHLKSSEETYYSTLLQAVRGEHEPPVSLSAFCAHSILLPERFLTDLKCFHEAFAAALTNIVQRWFADSAADFPSRMPLEPHEQQLLEVTSYPATLKTGTNVDNYFSGFINAKRT